MIHILLLLVCILSVEVFIKLNFLSLIYSIHKVTKRVTYIIPQNNISDHWKEKAVPAYALKIMKYSLQTLFNILLILSFFLIASFFVNGFLVYTLSFAGILESIIIAFGYVHLRKSFIK